MAKNYEQIYEAVYTKGNKMDFGNSIIRGNGVPLDITSVYDSFDSAVIYAATNPVAYEGQLVAVTENNETIVYVISPASQEKKTIGEVEYDVYLARVGSVTLGDGDSIVLDEETGVLSLKGFADAGTNTKLIKDADGNLAWVTDKATEIQGGISALENRMDTAEANIATNTGNITTNANDIDALEGRMDTVEANIATNTSNITTNANAIDALEAKFESMGGIFNFAGTCTSDELANLDKTKYQPGDVILVDGTKEYLAIEDGETIKWEPFGDAQGVSAIAGKVATLEGQINGIPADEEAGTSAVKGLTEKLADEVAARGVTDGKVATLEADNTTNKTDIANLKLADETLQGNIDAKVAQTEYNEKIAELVSADETLQTNIDAKVAQADYDVKVKAIEDALALKAVAADVATELGKKVDNSAYEAKVAKLEGDIDSKADKATYEAKVAELAEDIADNAKAIADHAGEYTTLSGKVTVNEQAIALKADKSVVDGHTTTIGEHATAIGKNTADIATEKGRIDSLITTVNNNKTAADKIEADLATLTTTVNNNKAVADKTQEDLDVVEGKVEALEKVGAQANVIEKVKVNGVELSITDKAVDVTVPTGTLANKNEVAETDLATELATKINGKLDKSEVTGNLLTHNASEFATAEQGAKADTALQAADIVNKADKADTLAGYGIGNAFTKDEVAELIQEAKDYADTNDANATYSIEYDNTTDPTNPVIKLVGANGGATTSISAKEFIKDGMLDKAEYDVENNKIVLTWNTDAGKETMDIDLNDLVDTYTGEGAINVSNDGKITVIEKGITEAMLAQDIQDSLALADTAIQEHQNISHLATKEEVEGVESELTEAVKTAQIRADDAYELAETKATMEEVSKAITDAAHASQADLVAHTGNSDIHVTTDDKAKWNAAEQNAKDYADGLAVNYDAQGSAEDALAEAKKYTDDELIEYLTWGTF